MRTAVRCTSGSLYVVYINDRSMVPSIAHRTRSLLKHVSYRTLKFLLLLIKKKIKFPKFQEKCSNM